MNTKELLELGSKTIDAIHEAAKEGNMPLVRRLLNSPQPVEWIRSEASQFYSGRSYNYNEISLAEALFEELFPGYEVCLHSNTILGHNGKFSSITIVQVDYKLCGIKMPVAIGTAAEYAPTVEWLTLATPASFMKAKTAAFRSVGDFLGKSLNRETENLPVKQIGNDTDEQNAKLLKETIAAVKKAKTKEAALKIVKDAGFSHFHSDLKGILETKN